MAYPQFIFGGNTGVTYEDLQRRRAVAEALQNRANSGIASNVGEGIAQLGAAIAGRIAQSRVNADNATGMKMLAEALSGDSGTVTPTAAPATDPGMASGIVSTADALGIDPTDLATAISYETGGTFDPVKAGPTTQWGQHKGLIQFGEPQAKQYGVDWNNPVASQLGKDGAIVKYLRDAGVTPGMGLKDVYSAINAGRVGRYSASDANNGGAPGTVADKVANQMTGHRAKAAALLAGNAITPAAGPPPEISNADYLGQFRDAVPPEAAKFASGFVAPFLRQPDAPHPSAQIDVPPRNLAGIGPPVAPPPQVIPAATLPEALGTGTGPMTAFQRMTMNAVDRGTMSEPRPGYTAQRLGLPQGGQPAPAGPMAAATAQAPVGANAGQQQGPSLARLQAFISSPYFSTISPAQQEFILKQYDRQYAAANPSPADQLDMDYKRAQIKKLTGRDTVTVGGNLVDAQTGEVIYKAPADPGAALDLEKKRLEVDELRNPKPDKPPSAVQEYEYARGQGFKGTFQDWESSKKGGMQLHVDPATGEVTFQQGGNIKPLTESQSKDTVYATRAEGALKVLDPLADALTSLPDAAGGSLPLVGNYLKSPIYQQAEQSGKEFLQAILRKDTGAAITKAETDEYGTVYLPRPGDSIEVLAQKKQSRLRAVEALKAGMTPQAILAQEKAMKASEAPQASQPASEAPPKPGDIVDGFRFKGGDPSDEGNWEFVR